jgi:hypothetical protein
VSLCNRDAQGALLPFHGVTLLFSNNNERLAKSIYLEEKVRDEINKLPNKKR